MLQRFPLISTLFLTLLLSACTKSPTPPNPKPTDPAPPPAAKTPTIPIAFTNEGDSLISPQDVPLLGQINRENTRVVAAALPSIVRIIATRSVDPRMQLFGRDLPFQLPFGPNQHDAPRANVSASGSGVIISKDGYLLTNDHVIDDAKDIQVQLGDKRTFPARLVAADEAFDIAVLKIEATHLAALPWGDSDKVQVGEQVFAIGNPFDLDDSVSKGIVSAKGRSIPDASNYADFIQTDAAINPGNSGGALVNIYGQLIGINAAIASTSRVNMGVGFAIPSNLVRYAVEGLLKDGKLVRGYLGVILPSSVDDGVITQLGLKSTRGALLAGIMPGSPAEKAGLRLGDFITEIDGHKIESVPVLRLVVAQITIGREVPVKYVRDGNNQSAQIKITDVPVSVASAPRPAENEDQVPTVSGVPSPTNDNVLASLQVTDLNDKTRKKYNINNFVTSGVVITGVERDSAADLKGLAPGQVIQSLGISHGSPQPITAAKDFADLAKTVPPGQGVILLIRQGTTSSFLYLSR